MGQAAQECHPQMHASIMFWLDLYQMSHFLRQKRSYAEHLSPLFHPLPGLKLPSRIPDSIEHHPTKITVLPNGLRIASENSTRLTACLGLYVDCGSMYETEESMGITHDIVTICAIVHEIEATGRNVAASASREHMGYSYDTLKTYTPEAIEILIDFLRIPLFLDRDVKEQVAKVKTKLGEISKDPQQFLLESLHLVGYSGTLGNPLIAPNTVLGRIDGSSVGNFIMYEEYHIDRTILQLTAWFWWHMAWIMINCWLLLNPWCIIYRGVFP